MLGRGRAADGNGLELRIARPRQAFGNVGQVVEPPTLGRAREDPARRRFEQVKQARRQRRDASEDDEEWDVPDAAPKPADLAGREASAEDRQIPGRNGARAELGRRKPGEYAQAVGQDEELAECKDEEVAEQPRPMDTAAAG